MTREEGQPLRAIAAALSGEVVGGQVIAPGPGHSRRDRSMTVRPSATAPNGFLVYSHAGDDYRPCRDYVRKALGIDFEAPRKKRRPSVIEPPAPPNAAQHDRCGLALDLWSASVNRAAPSWNVFRTRARPRTRR